MIEDLSDDIFLHILGYVGFGKSKGKNMITNRRISKRFLDLIQERIVFEVDHHTFVSVNHFVMIYNQLYISLVQKRNHSIDWDDYRGYLIIQNYDDKEWRYYDQLICTYYFRPYPSPFPHYRGQIYFYEFPSFL